MSKLSQSGPLIMRKSKIALLMMLVVFGVSVILGIQVYFSIGGSHTTDDKNVYANSPQYDAAQDRFVNHNQQAIDEMKDKVFNYTTIVSQLSIREDLTPDEKLPDVVVDLRLFLDDATGPNIVWLGHSSLLIRIAGKTLLVDPVFGNAGPVFFIGRRFQDNVIELDELPDIDYVLISHDHYDHLEASTVKYFAEQASVQFIVPIGVGAHLKQWRVPESRFVEMDWWEEIQLDDLLVATTPSQHYSGRGGFLANDTLWTSFVIKGLNSSVYLSGDSGYGDHFSEINRRYGPFDLAFLENGQYSWMSREVHMHPEDVVKSFSDLDAKVLIPIHWAMFQLSRHPWYDPVTRLAALTEENDHTLYVPKIGEIMNIRAEHTLDEWWIPLVKRQQGEK